MKRFGIVILFVISFLPFVSQAQPAPTASNYYTYKPLIADFPQPDAGKGSEDFAGFFNYIFKLVIQLTGVLAVLMIVVGGIQYVSTDSWLGKDSGKKRIQAALGGLILALSSFLILNSIDPSLTYLNFAEKLAPVGGINDASLIPSLGGAADGAPEGLLTYDLNESESLDPTGSTGGLVSGNLNIPVNADSCEGLSEYRAAGNHTAMDKGKNNGSVVGEIAWLMQVIPQKFPGLTVMSSYRSLRWNLTSAYKIPPSIADKIATDVENSNGSRAARMAILDNYANYGLKSRPANAALTSNHVLGRAVDFAGPGLGTHGTALANWAETNSCIRFSEILWGAAERHTDHVHLGV